MYNNLAKSEMKKNIIVAVAAIFMSGALAFAQGGPGGPGGPRGEAKDDSKKEAPVNLTVTDGLFGVSQNDKDWYFDIPDEILGRRILAVTRYVSMTPGASEYGGEEVNEAMVYWEKAPNGNLLLRVDVLNITADEDQDIYKAVKVSSENPIVASFKP